MLDVITLEGAVNSQSLKSTFGFIAGASLAATLAATPSHASTFVGSFNAQLPGAPGGELEVSFSIPDYSPAEAASLFFSTNLKLTSNLGTTDPAQYRQFGPGTLIVGQFALNSQVYPNDFSATIDTSVPQGEVDVTFNSPSDTLQTATTTLQSGVPEPGTWVLMLIGFGGIGGVMRRRRVRAPVAA